MMNYFSEGLNTAEAKTANNSYVKEFMPETDEADGSQLLSDRHVAYLYELFRLRSLGGRTLATVIEVRLF